MGAGPDMRRRPPPPVDTSTRGALGDIDPTLAAALLELARPLTVIFEPGAEDDYDPEHFFFVQTGIAGAVWNAYSFADGVLEGVDKKELCDAIVRAFGLHEGDVRDFVDEMLERRDKEWGDDLRKIVGSAVVHKDGELQLEVVSR